MQVIYYYKFSNFWKFLVGSIIEGVKTKQVSKIFNLIIFN